MPLSDLEPKRVPKNVGLHPIAQAIAKQRMLQAATEQLIRLHLLEDGEQAMPDIQRVAFALMVADTLKPDTRIAGAMSALAQMSHTGRWRKLDTVAVTVALEAAVETIKQAKPKELRNAVEHTRAAEVAVSQRPDDPHATANERRTKPV